MLAPLARGQEAMKRPEHVFVRTSSFDHKPFRLVICFVASSTPSLRRAATREFEWSYGIIDPSSSALLSDTHVQENIGKSSKCAEMREFGYETSSSKRIPRHASRGNAVPKSFTHNPSERVIRTSISAQSRRLALRYDSVSKIGSTLQRPLSQRP
ncbi:hypothetical protein SCHPADRAFT_611969 [Schizopora paradoxa]|uniref:Uncharacterized protein n=1 Tax=Schizopora paradoxa TaxID=27342 RepID=A0A0H2R910_9AGAM|nr:hypothetical protein SCHPADRAFT_611969 [Schizopora paradoxa]